MTAARKLWGAVPSLVVCLMPTLALVATSKVEAAIHSGAAANFRPAALASAPDLSGSWRMDCLKSGGGGPYGSQSQSLSITFASASENVFQVIFYADQECKHQAVSLSVRRPFRVRQDYPVVSGAYPIDFGPGTMELTALDPKVKLDDACAGKPHCLFVEDFNLAYISGNQLMLGLQTDANDGSTAAKRPVEIDHSRFLTRQER